MKNLINYGVPIFVNMTGTFCIIAFANDKTLIMIIAIASPALSLLTGLWIRGRMFL